MKSWLVHYTNKYPGGRVEAMQRDMIVYCAAGKKRVQLWKNGADMWVDVSADHLCVDSHDLAPLPKEARAFKLYADGRVGPAEEHDDRVKVAQELARHPIGGPGKVPSLDELTKAARAAKAPPQTVQAALEPPKDPALEAEYRLLKEVLEQPIPALV